jgi:hypothetical protein
MNNTTNIPVPHAPKAILQAGHTVPLKIKPFLPKPRPKPNIHTPDFFNPLVI